MGLLRHHNLNSAWKRISLIVSQCGFMAALAICLAELEEHFVRSFDRKRGVKTTGFIHISSTSLDRDKLPDAASYRPVNAWAFRAFLRRLSPPKTLHFADLGCGLGRACILAAEYGFVRVTGVDLVPEFCSAARQNLLNCGLSATGKATSVSIVQADALDYCAKSDADVFYMYRTVSIGVLRRILDRLSETAKRQGKNLTVIFCENILVPDSQTNVFSSHKAFQSMFTMSSCGFAFYAYRCIGEADRANALRETKTLQS